MYKALRNVAVRYSDIGSLADIDATEPAILAKAPTQVTTDAPEIVAESVDGGGPPPAGGGGGGANSPDQVTCFLTGSASCVTKPGHISGRLLSTKRWIFSLL